MERERNISFVVVKDDNQLLSDIRILKLRRVLPLIPTLRS
jgi:hypothetical protein